MKKKCILILTASMFLLTFCNGCSSTKTSNDPMIYNSTKKLSNDTSIATIIGNIDGLSVTDVPSSATLDAFVNSITVHKNATFNIFETDRTIVASIIETSCRLVVTAENRTSSSCVLTAETGPRLTASWNSFDHNSDEYNIAGAVFTNSFNGNKAALDCNGGPSVMDYLVYQYSDDLTFKNKGAIKVWVKTNPINPYY